MALDLWALAILLSKLIAYISFASLTGGFFVIYLNDTQNARNLNSGVLSYSNSSSFEQRLLPFLLSSSVLGLVCVLLFFLLQLGAINQNGIPGMFDWLMTTIVLQSAVGTGVGLKAASFVLFIGLTLVMLASHKRKSAPPIKGLNSFAAVLAIALACAGFSEMGHVVSLGVLEQFALALHVLAIALWVGSFYPLYLLCRTEQGVRVLPLMKRFGDWGWAITLSLSIAGGYLLTQLLSSPIELISTSYGVLMLIKVLCVLCLLGLAALNKFRLVPALSVAGTQALARSIKGEMCLAAVVLILTALLSTLTGPDHLMG